ncbi:hypothetical protein [Phaeovulum sp.]
MTPALQPGDKRLAAWGKDADALRGLLQIFSKTLPQDAELTLEAVQ